MLRRQAINTINTRSWCFKARRILYWALPGIILWIVFQRIDWSLLKLSLVRTNPWLATLGIGYYPLVITIGALRWHLLLAQYTQESKTRFCFKALLGRPCFGDLHASVPGVGNLSSRCEWSLFWAVSVEHSCHLG